MNYNRLRYFYEVARMRNITKAADELYVSQPALSKQISSLEKELGAPLFRRTGRGLILTQAGEHLYKECELIFSREAQIEDIMGEIQKLYSPRLKVASMGTDALYNMPGVIERLHEAHPDIEVEYTRMNWGEVKRAVEAGDADAGIIISYRPESSPDLCHAHILEARYSIILPAHHRYAGLAEVSMEMLRDEKFVFVSKDEREFPYDPYGTFLSDCKKAGYTPRIAATHPYVEMVLLAVQAGEGVTLLSTFAPMHHIAGLQSVVVSDLPPVYLDLIWHRTAENGNIGLFLDALKGFFTA